MTVCGKEIRIEGKILRIARLEGDGYDFIDDPEAILEGLRTCGRRIDIFTFLQKVTDTTPKFGYAMEWDNFAALPVTSLEHWRKEQIRWEARNRSRQAEKKGVTLREVRFDDELVKGIWSVYNECPVRAGKPSRHYGKDFATVYKEEATFLDRSIFIGAFLDGALIGFVKLVADETWTQANLMNIISMVRHRDKAPTNALVAEAVRCCAERRIPYLLYNNFSYGKKKPDGAVRFKENNGFQQVNVPRYYVPLTMLGDFAHRTGLHKGIVYHIPEPVLEKVRQLRNAWYNRRLQSVAEAS
jgi:hypothetical protein